jgi:hypothetical protein
LWFDCRRLLNQQPGFALTVKASHPACKELHMLLRATRSAVSALALTALLLSGAALAQQSPQTPSPPKPYKQVSVNLPAPLADPSLEAFRKQLTDIAQRKDRAALAALIVPRGFFWEREGGDAADEKKSGIDNFAAATGLDAPDGSGWEFLADYAAEPTAAPAGDQQDIICAPAAPTFSEDDFIELVKATQTNPIEWGYPLHDGIEAREAAKPGSPVVEKLGMHFVRVVIDEPPPEAEEPVLRIVTPSGKLAFIPADGLSPLGIDQLCYVKENGAWKITGYVGEGAPQ